MASSRKGKVKVQYPFFFAQELGRHFYIKRHLIKRGSYYDIISSVTVLSGMENKMDSDPSYN